MTATANFRQMAQHIGLAKMCIRDSPGQATITCNPFFKFSIRTVSRNPVIAYFEAE